VGLEREQHKKIGALSKGYRQRVGLAQAMIHDPKVLILDEPTSGLDPNQLEEVRALIKRLGDGATMMLSTHIMQEVEAICDRVIIIDKGRIVADDQAEKLRGMGDSQQALLVEFNGRTTEHELTALPGVIAVVRGTGHLWTITFNQEQDIRPTVFQFAVDKGLKVLTLQRAERDLEQVFKEKTKG
jgi:ABC-2 type transport system ATP-binding protein